MARLNGRRAQILDLGEASAASPVPPNSTLVRYRIGPKRLRMRAVAARGLPVAVLWTAVRPRHRRPARRGRCRRRREAPERFLRRRPAGGAERRRPDRMAGSVETLRFPIYWSKCEPRRGEYDFSGPDAEIARGGRTRDPGAAVRLRDAGLAQPQTKRGRRWAARRSGAWKGSCTGWSCATDPRAASGRDGAKARADPPLADLERAELPALLGAAGLAVGLREAPARLGDARCAPPTRARRSSSPGSPRSGPG